MLIDEKWVSFIQADGLCNPVKLGSSSLLVEISYLVINKKNRNNQEPGPILTGIFIEKYPLQITTTLKTKTSSLILKIQ